MATMLTVWVTHSKCSIKVQAFGSLGWLEACLWVLQGVTQGLLGGSWVVISRVISRITYYGYNLY